MLSEIKDHALSTSNRIRPNSDGGDWRYMERLTRAYASRSDPGGAADQRKTADDPCRTIEIVALAGQLCTTAGDVLIVTACATQEVPAWIHRMKNRPLQALPQVLPFDVTEDNEEAAN
jgi:hypothetical protein